jgi:hypothetical protein
MMVELANFAVKRRPPKSALARNTDGGDQFDPTPAWTMGGGLGGATHHAIVVSPKKWQNIRLSSDVTNPLSRSRN